MPVGTVTDFRDNYDFIYSIWDRRSFNDVQKCYTLFQNTLYKPYYNYYFFFEAVPFWILDFIEELNSFFTNIKYEVIDNKEGRIITEDQWGSSVRYIRFDGSVPTDKDIKVCCPLFTIKLSKGYSLIAKKFIYYVLHHIVRMFSITEDFISKDIMMNKPENILDYLIELNNNYKKKYRTVSEIPLDRDYLKLLDDIELVNKTFPIDKFLTQTEIFKNLKRSHYTDAELYEYVFLRFYYRYNRSREFFEVNKLGYLGKQGIYYIDDNGGFCNSYTNCTNITKATTINEIGNLKVGDLVISREYYGDNIVYIPTYAKIITIFNNAPEEVRHTAILLERQNGSKAIFYYKEIKKLPKNLYKEYGIK